MTLIQDIQQLLIRIHKLAKLQDICVLLKKTVNYMSASLIIILENIFTFCFKHSLNCFSLAA